jgi:hypothetical protein
MVHRSSDKALVDACFVEKGWRGAIFSRIPGKELEHKVD